MLPGDAAATTRAADATTTAAAAAADPNDAAPTVLSRARAVQDASHAHQTGHDGALADTPTHGEPDDEDGGNAGGNSWTGWDAGSPHAAAHSEASPRGGSWDGPAPRGRGLLPSRCPVPGSPTLPPAGVLPVTAVEWLVM